MQKYTFHVHGMHCASCVVLTESELQSIPEVQSAKATLATCCVEVSGEFTEKTPEAVARKLSEVLVKHGYTLSLEKEKKIIRWSEFKTALPLALACIALFVLLQKIGVVNLVSSSEVTYGTAFVIGLIASVSTCMAVVGGLVLSVSANFAKTGDVVRSQVFFHVGRFVSFFILGGVLGALGAVFQLGTSGTFVLGIAIGIIMLLLGINLLDIFPWAKKVQLTMPTSFAKYVNATKNAQHSLVPLLIGVGTFFLPCGFTQSMQFYAVSTGDFWSGSLIMTAFALGTFPVLALLSFGFSKIKNTMMSGVFFKAAGIVVIFFAIINLLTTLAAAGIISPVINF